VEEAATGGEGLRLAAHHPGLVVLDVNLPDINGFEVCRRIKAHPATAAIPVLHLSGAFVNPDDASRGLAGGADGYLTKPVDPQILIAWTKALLRSRRTEGGDPAAQAPSPGSPLDVEGEGLPDRPQANGEPPAESEDAGEKSRPSVDFQNGQRVFRGNGAGEDAFLGVAVALGVEACLAVLVVLPLCGVAVPTWALFLALAPTLTLLARCIWVSYRGGR
jgi:CheY-like chemotaxis protein